MKTTLRAQFLTFTCTAILLTGSSACLYLLRDSWRFSITRIENDIHKTAKFVAVDVVEDLYFRNLAGLRRVVDRVKTNEGIEVARLFVWDGESLAAITERGVSKPEIVSAFVNQALAGGRWRAQQVTDRVEGVMPIFMDNGQKLGAFHIVASLKAPLDALKHRALWSVSITVIWMLIAAAALWAWTRKLAADIGVMGEIAESVSLGDLSRSVALRRSDELGELGRSINRMVGQLRVSRQAQLHGDASIAKLNAELKTAVTRFTADLTARNEELAGEFARREQLEAKLHAADRRLRAVLEIAPDAVVTTDEQGNIIEFNKVAETIFGYRRHVAAPARSNRIATIYRNLTDDRIGMAPRVIGGALWGRLTGVVTGVINSLVEWFTGKDIGDHIYAKIWGEPANPNAVARAAESVSEKNSMAAIAAPELITATVPEPVAPPDEPARDLIEDYQTPAATTTAIPQTVPPEFWPRPFHHLPYRLGDDFGEPQDGIGKLNINA